ncbi:Carboxylesterase, type B [Actinokineospora spheciospongiae]|uniref:Carboxylesterase, type B n=1 Tax=Actinokineospora spheciospongiae TaxID=909613 RepID=W7J3N1_9PSEU|nr:carboxylesterase family protein [Actinokineospora spheciospongiae]EWC63657.1 Carboxylesterase, type B [Actinokineospora spheciospongiae]
MAQRQLRTRMGTLLVTDDGAVVRARGVRYATAGRFERPEAVRPWSGVVDATRRGPICPQPPSRLGFATGEFTDGMVHSEDCLVVTVAAPAGADGLPVLVWIHGGAYVEGTGECAKYDPVALAAEAGVVVVNVSYRVGVLGYLAPTQAGGADNLGLRDQVLALRWVRDNIADFGGDPGNVTAFGQSAGADSVLALMLSEEADGLFHRAIMQSAPLSISQERAPLFAAVRARLTHLAHGASTAEILAAQDEAVAVAHRFGAFAGMPYGPVLGSAPLPSVAEVPARLADAASRVELLIGHTKHDASPFVVMSPAGRRLTRLGRSVTRIVSAGATKQVFADPAHRLADTWASNGGSVARYRFDRAPGFLGAGHCVELPYLLGTPDSWSDSPMMGGKPLDRALATRLRRTWGDFARGGVAALESTNLRFG